MQMTSEVNLGGELTDSCDAVAHVVLVIFVASICFEPVWLTASCHSQTDFSAGPYLVDVDTGNS